MNRHALGRPHGATHGLTLVELLVAIAVMATLSLLAWRSLDGMARTERLTRERTDHLLALQAGLGQWGADLDNLIETGVVPALDFDGRSLRLTRRDPHDSDTHSAGVRVVAWALHAGRWMRWQATDLQTRPDLLQAWSEAQRWGQQPLNTDAPRQVAVADAQGWQLFYYRNDSWSNPLSSSGTAPETPNSAAALPKTPDGVRLVLTLPPGQPWEGNLVRDWARPVLGGGKS